MLHTEQAPVRAMRYRDAASLPAQAKLGMSARGYLVPVFPRYWRFHAHEGMTTITTGQWIVLAIFALGLVCSLTLFTWLVRSLRRERQGNASKPTPAQPHQAHADSAADTRSSTRIT